jgi:hypothetical protein
VDAGADGAELGVEDLGDLLVGQALDVAEDDGGPEVRRQLGQGPLHVVVEGAVGVVVVRRGDGAAQPGGTLVGEGVEADPLLAAGLVQEQVGGDPVQPALEGARCVGRQRAEHPDEHVLGQVLGVRGVAGETVGQPVDALGVLVDDLVPAGNHRGGIHRRLLLATAPQTLTSLTVGNAAERNLSGDNVRPVNSRCDDSSGQRIRRPDCSPIQRGAHVLSTR